MIRVYVTFQSNHQIGVAVHRTRAPVLGRETAVPLSIFACAGYGTESFRQPCLQGNHNEGSEGHAGTDNRMRYDETQSTFTAIPHTARDDALSMRMDLSLERGGPAKLRPDKPRRIVVIDRSGTC